MSKYFQVYDIEHSHPKVGEGDIIALSCMIGRTDTLELVDKLTTYGRPRNLDKWSDRGAEYHGFTKEACQEHQTQEDMAKEILNFLVPYKCENNTPLPFVMHASNFVDYTFIRSLFSSLGYEDSFLKIAVEDRDKTIRTNFVFKEYLSNIGKNNLKPNLKVMAEEFGVELNHHEAESDTYACFYGLTQMIKHYKPLGGIFSTKMDYSGFNNLVNLYQP